MQGIIQRESILRDAFNRYDVHEAYSEVDFTFGKDNVTLVALVRNKDSVNGLYMLMTHAYDNPKCYITDNPHDLILSGLKIIYRDGAWYV